MTERVLITGAAGFVGRHLARHLYEQGLIVHGLDRPSIPVPADLHIAWHTCDITHAAQVAATVGQVQPDYIFHLVALIKSKSLADLLAVNVLGTQNVLDALVKVRAKAHVLVTGSAAEYGVAKADELPIRESHPLRPLSLYGISKVAQGLLAIQYAYCQHLAVVCTRTFNLVGPGQLPGLVGADFARRIVQVERSGPKGCIRVGNLTAQRDFVDVRDAVRAYWLACSQGMPGEVYNVCSGRPVQIEQVLRWLVEHSTSHIQVVVDAGPMSSQDVSISFGSAEKLHEATGWQPAVSLDQSLQDLLAERRRVTLTCDE